MEEIDPKQNLELARKIQEMLARLGENSTNVEIITALSEMKNREGTVEEILEKIQEIFGENSFEFRNIVFRNQLNFLIDDMRLVRKIRPAFPANMVGYKFKLTDTGNIVGTFLKNMTRQVFKRWK